jgi:hypothetical protein
LRGGGDGEFDGEGVDDAGRDGDLIELGGGEAGAGDGDGVGAEGKMPVPVLVTTTAALETTAPVESVTVPLMPPRKVWARVEGVSVKKRARSKRKYEAIRFMEASQRYRDKGPVLVLG